MKHYKIVDYDNKIVVEFDIEDNEMLVLSAQPTGIHSNIGSNHNRYLARESDLK